MWNVFELTYKVFKAEAVDFLDGVFTHATTSWPPGLTLVPEMLPSLDNFISYGTDVFKARADYRQMVLDVYITSITSDHLGENDAVNGSKLAESMLLNLRGHIDEVS